MAEFTREQLIAEVHYNLEHCFCSEKTKRIMEIALAALTADIDAISEEIVEHLVDGGTVDNAVTKHCVVYVKNHLSSITGGY